jgi:hypothetical protein
MDIVVYTSIIGNYDKPRNDILVVKYDKFKQDVRNARTVKILSHKFVKADVSIWLDGNISLTKEPQYYIDKYLGDADMVTWKHPYRDCLYEEAEEAKIRVEEEYWHEIDEQVTDYKKEGIQPKGGMLETNVMIRRHNKSVEKFNNAWFAELCKYSHRDQVSIMKVLKDNPLKINEMIGDVRNHEDFIYIKH